jgi:glycosyltransferase involved in cell wall biosynthesis
MNSPIVSVVIATRNYAQYLGSAITSVLNQTLTDFELLIIDDGSTDSTRQVVQKFRSDPRMRYIASNNLGQTRAKNLGITLSCAPKIAFLDGDDLWHPSKLEKQLDFFGKDPEVALVHCRRQLIDSEGNLLPTIQPEGAQGKVYDTILQSNPVCFSSIMIRREVLDRVGWFDERLELAIDYDLWLRVSRDYRFGFIDEILVDYRTGHGNLSKRLIDRLQSVTSTMRRSLDRRDNSRNVSQKALQNAWGSTYRTLAYATRETSRWQAIKACLKAMCWDGRILATIKAIMGLSFKFIRSRIQGK